MAIIGMRDLLRDTKKVFKDVEKGGESMVVTRNGRPVAALIPVTEENAERLMLGATPEYAATRGAAEHSRAEGRTQSLEEAIAEYNARPDATTQVETDESRLDPFWSQWLERSQRVLATESAVSLVRTVFGVQDAERFATEAKSRLAAINEGVISAAGAAGLPEGEAEDAERLVEAIENGNEELFSRVWFEALRETITSRLAVAEPNEALGILSTGALPQTLDREVVETALDDATEKVAMLNGAALMLGREFGKGHISLQTYGAVVCGADVFGRVVRQEPKQGTPKVWNQLYLKR